MPLSSKIQRQEILGQINELEPKTRVLSALASLSGDPVPGYTWKEFDEAYRARQEIGRLMDKLRDLK